MKIRHKNNFSKIICSRLAFLVLSISLFFIMFTQIKEVSAAENIQYSQSVVDLHGNTIGTLVNTDTIVENGNIEIEKWARTDNDLGQLYKDRGKKYSPSWTWTQLTAVGDPTIQDLSQVWDGSRSASHYYNNYLPDGRVTYLNGKLYDSATWTHKGENMSESTLHRFRGEFSIDSFDPNNYAFTVSTVTGENIYINDNIFVFVYPKGIEVTDENYRNYFAFWTGTITYTEYVPDATYLGYSATTLKGKTGDTYVDLNQVTDGWHLTSAQDNVGDIILKSFNNTGNTDFVIDVFVEDFADGGGMYRPVLQATEITRHELSFKKIDSESGIGIMGAEFTLLGESNNTKYTAVSGEDGFVIMNVPSGTYTLKEEKAPNGYSVSGATWTVVVADDGTYTITGTGASMNGTTAQISNVPEKETLTVSKKVIGTTEQKNSSFEFTLAVKYANNVPYTVAIEGADKVEDGKYKFELKDGETKIFKLPKVCKYIVSETSSDEYITSTTGNLEGNLSTSQTISFTNTYKITKLIVSKKVAGAEKNPALSFKFKLELETKDGIPLTGFELDGLTESTSEKGVYTFNLKNTESITIYPLPYGCSYKITETDYSDTWYKTYITNSADNRKTNSLQTTGKLTDNLNPYELIENGVISAIDTVVYENVVQEVDLEVAKNVTGNLGDRNKSFGFSLILSTATGDSVSEDVLKESSYTKTFQDGSEQTGQLSDLTGGTFYLKDDEKIIFTIPYRYQYSIVENDYSGNGYITSLSITKGETTETIKDKSEYKDIALSNTKILYTNAKDAVVDTGVDNFIDSNRVFLCCLVAVFAVMTVILLLRVYGRKRIY